MYCVQIGCVILTLVTISCAYEVCYEKQFDGTSLLKTCSTSCCGTSNYKYCCSSSSTTFHKAYNAYSLTTGVIVGIVIGFLCLIALIVGGIIMCCVCCCKSSPGHRGQVIQNQQQLTVVSGTTNAAYTPGCGPAPVAYPPAPGAGNPGAYPPAQAAYPPAPAAGDPGAYPPAPAYTQAAYPPGKQGTYPPPQNAGYPPPVVE